MTKKIKKKKFYGHLARGGGGGGKALMARPLKEEIVFFCGFPQHSNTNIFKKQTCKNM